ncbi:GGDEF domain-containing protein [Xanthobacter autotrophicus]|uniref:GGDEF domain-containing protein n=1 Tax=Xanthobacter autotrophicus TaxID=280 RepID=UPI001E599637|nr:GGDEF domain-containing protein [Xanthobacter autotrophicus]UDQ88052.1 GGDEF domain-containing protein [Xanthobacter autotrophicus]
MDFQVQTVLSVSAVVGLLLAGLQLLAGWRLRQSCVFVWSLANLFLTAGCVFLAARVDIGLLASVLVGNGCILIGMGLIYSGIRVFDERPPGLAAVATVALLGTGLLGLSLWSGNNMADRVTISSILVGGWSATAGRALLQTPGCGPIISRVASAIVLIMVAAGYTIRGVGVQFGLLPLPGNGGPAEVLVVIAGLGLAICWTFGSLYMVLEKVASLDDLTGLLNRRAALQRGEELLRFARARRQPFSLLLADLDHFKSVNDRFGHDVGDLALKHFAGLVPQSIRANDVAGRYGGEEFCILLPGAEAKGAFATAERLRLLVEEQLRDIGGHDIGVTLTVGAATYIPGSAGPDTIADLIIAADGALYAGKALGRNCTVIAQPPAGEAASAPRELPGHGAIAAEPSR